MHVVVIQRSLCADETSKQSVGCKQHTAYGTDNILRSIIGPHCPSSNVGPKHVLPLHDENPDQEGGIAPCRSPDLDQRIQTQGTVQAAVPFPASGHGRCQATCKETGNKMKKITTTKSYWKTIN
jgi:hypothetical protein